MAVRVVIVSALLAVVPGEQDDEVGHQIGQRVNAVGDQTLGPGKDSDADLCQRQTDVHADADPGAAGPGRSTLSGRVARVFGIVGESVAVHRTAFKEQGGLYFTNSTGHSAVARTRWA